MNNDLFPLTTSMDNYVRKIWYSKIGPTGPMLYLETSVDVNILLKESKNKGVPVLAFLLKASAKGLKEYPQMYHYCFDGNMVSGGDEIKITAAHELPSGIALSSTYKSSNAKSIDEISKEIASTMEFLPKVAEAKPGFLLRMMNKYPRLTYFIQSMTGAYNRSVMRHMAPFFITAINAPGIHRTLIQPFSSPTLIFNRAHESKAIMGISLSHGYGNARQIGAFLNYLKIQLENPQELL